MKTKILAVLMIAVISVGLFVFPAAAENSTEHTHIEVFFEDDTISEELKAKATAFYLNGGEDAEESTTWGLTCTILGHKYEDAATTVITHKAKAAAPRCLKNIYLYQTCTRCGHEKSTLMESVYIYCCA